ncbi:MAG: SUMF1/EgtB/PvdO family nonheme iron enzyme [Elusimicrobia bacterium]|nr:SUMF1/EgtB/PvdO family nonheme iron enzyme [Elusimicrobiota bacterium]
MLFLAAGAGAETLGIGFGPGQSMDVSDALSAARAGKSPDSPVILAGYKIENDPGAGKPAQAVEWVTVGGGKFTMGTDNGAGNDKPTHEVTIKTFELSKTHVTVEQYAECVTKRQCSKPATGGRCNWGKADRQKHPINCVSWNHATEFARFQGARLPSEAEWEYAATSGGKNQKYPWGNEEANCDRAVMHGNGGYGCGSDGTMPVCSKPAGNAKVSGGELCDMVGNVWQWVQDKYHSSYTNAPADGSAYEAAFFYRVLRGGSYYFDDGRYLRADYRGHGLPGYTYYGLGFRLARSSR